MYRVIYTIVLYFNCVKGIQTDEKDGNDIKKNNANFNPVYNINWINSFFNNIRYLIDSP